MAQGKSMDPDDERQINSKEVETFVRSLEETSMSRLVWYIRECMVSIININNGINELTRGYQNYNTIQILISNRYVNVSLVSLCALIIIWIDIILNHTNTRVILYKYEDSCMIYRPECY